MLIAEGDHLKEAIVRLNLETEEEHEAIPTFLESFLEDIVFEKFGVEMEQTNLAATDLSQSLQEKFHILAELKGSVLQKMTNPGELDQSEGEFSEEEV